MINSSKNVTGQPTTSKKYITTCAFPYTYSRKRTTFLKIIANEIKYKLEHIKSNINKKKYKKAPPGRPC